VTFWVWSLWLLLVCFIVVLVGILWLRSVEVVAVRIERAARYLSAVEQRRSCTSALNAQNFPVQY